MSAAISVEKNMPGVYETNVNFLQEKFPELLKLLETTPNHNCKLETAKNGSLTLSYAKDNIPYYLHSKFNPEEESIKILQKKDLNADHIVVLGLGLGYHLEKILEKKDPLARVLLIEPEIEILFQSLYRFPWHKWLKCKEFFYIFGPEVGLIGETLHQFINISAFEKVEFIELSSETRLLDVYFSKARHALEAEIKSNLYDFKTRLAESVMMPRNILNNFPLILKSRPITSLKNIFQGVPGFLVGAGPSLDKNVLYLKKIRDRALLVAVDTALKPLLARAIQPHFTAIGDPSYKNYLHVQGTEKKIAHFIVAEAGIAHRIYQDFLPHIFSLSIGKPITRLLEAHSEPLGEIEAWGSVISIALDFAVYIGLNPIIFIGQDFAFSNTRNHCRGTSWEEDKMEYTRNLDELQRFESVSIGGDRKIIETQNIYGHKTITSERLVLYKNFLARLVTRYPGTHFFNATEGGIFSEIPVIRLYDAMERFVFGKKTIHLGHLALIPTLDKEDNIKRSITFLAQKVIFFKAYQQKVVALLPLLEKSAPLVAVELVPLLQQAEQLQNDLYMDRDNGEIMEMWSAAPMYHYLKEYKSIRARQLNETTVRKGLELFANYFRNIKPLLKDIVRQLEKTKEKVAAYCTS